MALNFDIWNIPLLPIVDCPRHCETEVVFVRRANNADMHHLVIFQSLLCPSNLLLSLIFR